MRLDRAGTLRDLWLRAPPRSTRTHANPKPQSRRLTQKASYEGGRNRRRRRINVRDIREAILPTATQGVQTAWQRAITTARTMHCGAGALPTVRRG